jgi:hypothetical protein
MVPTSYAILKEFFENHLPFTPTAAQIAMFEADLALVNPNLMRDALKEVALGKALVNRSAAEWRQAIFAVYCRKIAEQAQLFPVFHALEVALRSTVAIKLEAKFGRPDWWRPVLLRLNNNQPARSLQNIYGVPVSRDACHLIGQIIYYIDGDRLQRQLVANMSNGFQFLECAKLDQIGRLITEFWTDFQASFTRNNRPLSKTHFAAKLNRVREARNDIFHHKSLTRMSGVSSAAEDLLDYLHLSLTCVCGMVTNSSATPIRFSIPIDAVRHRPWT